MEGLNTALTLTQGLLSGIRISKYKFCATKCEISKNKDHGAVFRHVTARHKSSKWQKFDLNSYGANVKRYVYS